MLRLGSGLSFGDGTNSSSCCQPFLGFLLQELPLARSSRRSERRSEQSSDLRSDLDFSLSLSRPWFKLAWAVFSSVTKVVAMSSSAWVVRGFLHPNLWMTALEVVPHMKALMMSASLMSGSSFRMRKKHWM